MKLSRFVAVLSLIVTMSAITISAQPTTQPYQEFWLDKSVVVQLGLTQNQVDAVNHNLLVLDYDWNEAANKMETLNEQIVVAEDDSSQSPLAIGATVGRLVEEKVVVARAIIAEVAESNKTLLAVLSPGQQAQLAGLQQDAMSALAVLTAYAESFFCNLVAMPWSVSSIDQFVAGGGWPPSIQPGGGMSQRLSRSVARIHVERATARAQVARKARAVQQQ